MKKEDIAWGTGLLRYSDNGLCWVEALRGQEFVRYCQQMIPKQIEKNIFWCQPFISVIDFDESRIYSPEKQSLWGVLEGCKIYYEVGTLPNADENDITLSVRCEVLSEIRRALHIPTSETDIYRDLIVGTARWQKN